MRILTIISLLVLCLGCASTKNSGSDSYRVKSNKLNGNWIPIKQEIGGKLLPTAAFESQKLIINDSTYTLIAESIDKGLVEVKEDKMDIYSKEGVNSGKHFTAVYKIENELLTICYNLSGDPYPETFETKSKPTLFLSVFKKEINK
jgi:uncharacterized protein (TIGR03067 family)